MGSSQLPDLGLDSLHQFHYGVTPEVGACYARAAAVCLGRHHQPPSVASVTGHDDTDGRYLVSWTSPSAREQAAFANRDDATRDGAYCLALAALHAHHNMPAISRTATGTGSDYYVGPPGSHINPGDRLLDLENALRLEVSGIDLCTRDSELWSRVNQKVDQLQRGHSNLPGLAGVVAFSLCRIVFRRAE